MKNLVLFLFLALNTIHLYGQEKLFSCGDLQTSAKKIGSQSDSQGQLIYGDRFGNIKEYESPQSYQYDLAVAIITLSNNLGPKYLLFSL